MNKYSIDCQFENWSFDVAAMMVQQILGQGNVIASVFV